MPNSVSLVSDLDALNITSDNIKDGVNILGVEGTYKGDSVVDDELRAVVTHTENRSRNVLTKTVEGGILHVEDAYVTEPREIVVNGAYEQFTTTGINLAMVDFETKTVNGVTFTNNGDGTFTIDGTPTTGIGFYLSGGSTKGAILKSGVTYVTYCELLSGSILNPNNKSFAYLLYTRNNGQMFIYNDKYVGSVYGELTMTSDQVHSVYMWLGYADGAPYVTFNNATFRIRTYEGAYTPGAIPDWEPYTGGFPSPNPSYPHEIETVTSADLEMRGKNIYDGNIDKYGYVLSSAGEENVAKDYIISKPIPVNDGEPYSFGFYRNNPNGGVGYDTDHLRVGIFDSDMSFIKRESNQYPFTFVMPSNAAFIKLSFSTAVMSQVTAANGLDVVPYEPITFSTTTIPLTDSNSNTYELVGIKDGFGDKLRIADNGDGTADVVLYKSTQIDTLPTSGWVLSDSEAKFGLANAVTKTPYTGEASYVYNGLSNRFSNVGLYEVGTYSITIWNSKYVDITHPDITTSEEFNTWIASNPVKVAYPLETPEVISLGTINLSALPENISNLWVNTNIPTTLQMTYERDIQAINKANVNAIATLIADVEFGLNEQGYLESYVPITAAYTFALNDNGELEVVG